MNQLVTRAIVLHRTNYGEADRIVTLLTPDQGKISVMARGVRRAKSKLAGGIELFSVADITYAKGRGSLGTLISTRLLTYYAEIVKDIDRVQLGYEIIKSLNRATEDAPESEYFDLLEQSFIALNDVSVDLGLIQLWFQAQLLRIAGHAPNLQTDTGGQKLSAEATHTFDFEAMGFEQHPAGSFSADHIKAMRLLFNTHTPRMLSLVEGLGGLLPHLQPLVTTMLQTYVRV